MPDVTSGTQSAGSYRGGTFGGSITAKPEPPITPKPAAPAKPKAKAKPRAKKPAAAKSVAAAIKADTPKKGTAVGALEFTSDGARAIQMTRDADGVIQSVVRDTTFEEQIEALAPLLLEQAIKIVHYANSGTISTSGRTITIKLNVEGF